MCYSAEVRQAYDDYVRRFGARIDLREFARLYVERKAGRRIRTSKAMDDGFLFMEDSNAQVIAALIEEWNAQQIADLEQSLFSQRKRLATAERSLRTKMTRKALNDQRIASNKIEWAKGKLTDLKRIAAEPRDARIFPGGYAPVMVMERGERVIKPMRYQCRPAGKPAVYDTRYPGTYNARRDNLEGFWRGQFGHSHGIVIVDAFYENVSRHKVEGRDLVENEREENLVLEFRPSDRKPMLVACLFSHWRGRDEPDLLSFAAITDEPPPEIAAAGHDRCIIPIKEEHLDAWLTPDPERLDTLYAILDDRERPLYRYRLAA
ncbi:MAG: hypothetical protein E6Q88_06065 [Lysobacteraceae bacterium]|nr:MAG: hypothetical protein E6Q88_06065 [Xanthomonadaceae bacterium]